MIVVNDLTKYYGRHLAVARVSFEVYRGEVFGLLGSNGAGKSTTIKMITGLLRPSYGNVTIGGYDVVQQPLATKPMLGYLPETPHLYEKLTGAETLELVGSLRNMDPNKVVDQIKAYSQALALDNQIYAEVGSYSKGMRQKLAIAMALIHDPPVLLLDEPSSGLDPRYTKMLKEWIVNLSRAGRTVMLSTHITEIAESLCDRVAIIDHGTLLAIGSISQLKQQLGAPSLEEVFVRLVERQGQGGSQLHQAQGASAPRVPG